MFHDYKGFDCIKRMIEPYDKLFDKIAGFYAEKLNRVVHDGGTIYTMHDFDHHCCDLYKIISNVILNGEYAYEENCLNSRELYILNLAVLLHDIGMIGYVDVGRDNHSVQSFKKINHDYTITDSPLSETSSGLCKNEIDALALIVKAHSDEKGENVNVESNGLNDSRLTNEMPGKVQIIKGRLLANILRMADELDVTSDRLSHIQIEQELSAEEEKMTELCEQLSDIADEGNKKGIEEQIERCKAAIQSNNHWRKLHLFKEVKRDEAGMVQLVVDDGYVETMLENGEVLEELADNILSVYYKVRKEFEMFQKDVSADLTYHVIIAMKDLELHTQNIELKEYLEQKEILQKEGNLCEGKQKTPTIISEELAKKLKKFVDDKNLHEVGHFKLHNDICSRDWIVVDEILETQEIFQRCLTQFLLHIKNEMEKDDKKYLIVGIDLGGILIASKLAYLLHTPYSYVVPIDNKRNSSIRELDLSTEQYDNIILITDVIVTFETIKNIVDEYNIGNKVSNIYALFFRNTEDGKYIQKNYNLVEKTYVLNDDFDIEIHGNDKCRYKDCDKCKASNRRYD